eukprot:3288194-Rhodomonas_salina.2
MRVRLAAQVPSISLHLKAFWTKKERSPAEEIPVLQRHASGFLMGNFWELALAQGSKMRCQADIGDRAVALCGLQS